MHEGMDAGEVHVAEATIRALVARLGFPNGERIDVVTSADDLARLQPVRRPVLAVHREGVGTARKFIVVNGGDRWRSFPHVPADASQHDLKLALADADVVVLQPAAGDGLLIERVIADQDIGVIHEVPLACVAGFLAGPSERMRNRALLAVDEPPAGVPLRWADLELQARLEAGLPEGWASDLLPILEAAFAPATPRLIHLPGYEIGVQDLHPSGGRRRVWINGRPISVVTAGAEEAELVVDVTAAVAGDIELPFADLLRAPLYAEQFGAPRRLAVATAPAVNLSPLRVEACPHAVIAEGEHVDALFEFLRSDFAADVRDRLGPCGMHTMLWVALTGERAVAIAWYDPVNAFAGVIAAPDLPDRRVAWRLFDALMTRLGQAGGVHSLRALVADGGKVRKGMEHRYRVHSIGVLPGLAVELTIDVHAQ